MVEESVEESFADWISSPQMLVGLSAILLSLCGLFVSVYEASLMRQQQRASVWPHVQVGPSFSEGRTAFIVRNTGVGPARIEAANLEHKGEVKDGWESLLQSVQAADSAGVGGASDSLTLRSLPTEVSLLSGDVIPPQSQRQTIFALGADAPDPLVRGLFREITEGRLNMTVCYCSVYGQCWVATLQGRMGVMRGQDPSRHRSVGDCEAVAQSEI